MYRKTGKKISESDALYLFTEWSNNLALFYAKLSDISSSNKPVFDKLAERAIAERDFYENVERWVAVASEITGVKFKPGMNREKFNDRLFEVFTIILDSICILSREIIYYKKKWMFTRIIYIELDYKCPCVHGYAALFRSYIDKYTFLFPFIRQDFNSALEYLAPMRERHRRVSTNEIVRDFLKEQEQTASGYI